MGFVLESDYSRAVRAIATGVSSRHIAIDAAVFIPRGAPNFEVADANANALRLALNARAQGHVVQVVALNKAEADIAQGFIDYADAKSNRSIALNVITADALDQTYFHALITDRPHIVGDKIKTLSVVGTHDQNLNARFDIA